MGEEGYSNQINEEEKKFRARVGTLGLIYFGLAGNARPHPSEESALPLDPSRPAKRIGGRGLIQ